MNIYTIRDNLINTIKGKEQYLGECEKTIRFYGAGQCESAVVQFSTTIDMLKININELRTILKDVTLCCVETTEKSWLGVDRQGGI